MQYPVSESTYRSLVISRLRYNIRLLRQNQGIRWMCHLSTKKTTIYNQSAKQSPTISQVTCCRNSGCSLNTFPQFITLNQFSVLLCISFIIDSICNQHWHSSHSKNTQIECRCIEKLILSSLSTRKCTEGFHSWNDHSSSKQLKAKQPEVEMQTGTKVNRCK